MSPGFALFLGLVVGGFAGLVIRGLVAIVDSDRRIDIEPASWRWVVRVTLVVMLPFVVALLWAVVVFLRAAADLRATRTIIGEVVRDRAFKASSSSSESPKYRRFMAIDDGTSDRISAFRLRRSRLWTGHAQGDTITVKVTPHLGYVRSLEAKSGLS